MRVRVIPYCYGHLDFMTMKYDYGDMVKALQYVDRDPNIKAFSLIVESPKKSTHSVIAVVGMCSLHESAAEVWMFAGVGLESNPISFQKAILELLDKTQESGVRRLQMTVLVEYEEGLSWAKSLGFKEECVMTAYDSQGRDHYLLSRVL